MNLAWAGRANIARTFLKVLVVELTCNHDDSDDDDDDDDNDSQYSH